MQDNSSTKLTTFVFAIAFGFASLIFLLLAILSWQKESSTEYINEMQKIAQNYRETQLAKNSAVAMNKADPESIQQSAPSSDTQTSVSSGLSPNDAAPQAPQNTSNWDEADSWR